MSTIDSSFYEIQELRHLIRAHENDKSQLHHELNGVARERKYLKDELIRVENENEELNAKNEELQQELNEMQAELEIRRKRDSRFELMDL